MLALKRRQHLKPVQAYASSGSCHCTYAFPVSLVEIVLSGLTQKICMVYIDDVLVISKNFTEHLDNLRKVFFWLRAAGLRLKPVKCTFGSKVVYLGFVVSREGMSPDLHKVQAVRDFPQPRDVKFLQSFLHSAVQPVCSTNEVSLSESLREWYSTY